MMPDNTHKLIPPLSHFADPFIFQAPIHHTLMPRLQSSTPQSSQQHHPLPQPSTRHPPITSLIPYSTPGPDTNARIDVYNKYGCLARRGEIRYAEKRVKVVRCRSVEVRVRVLVRRAVNVLWARGAEGRVRRAGRVCVVWVRDVPCEMR